MSTLQMWSLVAGFCIPPVLAILIQSKWSPKLKAIVAFIVALVVATVTTWIQLGGFHGRPWVESALTVLVAAIATYHGLWRPTGVAPTIETATNV